MRKWCKTVTVTKLRNKKNNTSKINLKSGGGPAVVPVSKMSTILASRAFSNRAIARSARSANSSNKKKALSWNKSNSTSKSKTPTSPPIQIKRRNRRIRQSTVRPFVDPIVSGEGQTWYTPTFDIISTGNQIPSVEPPNEPVNEYRMSPFQGTYDKSTMLIPFDKTIAMSNITPEEYMAVGSIQKNPSTYSYLAPIIYETLSKMGKSNTFGLILVYGRIRDELIPVIISTPVDVLRSRLFFNTISEVNTFVNLLKELYTTGPNPNDPRQRDISDIKTMTPLSRAPSAQSLQLVGYSTHPMFRPNPLSRGEEMQLVQESDKNPKLAGDEFVAVIAHGAIGDELSPEMKILANKYLRIIEVGRAGQLTGTLYKSFAFELNKILRNPNYFAMFDNTYEGESVRKGAFQTLCPYFTADNVNLCETGDRFNLIEITHERLFSGHHPDSMIPEHQKITYKSILNFITLGIFLPLEYENDTSTRYVSKKELFRLYPGTTFLSLTTTLRLIETLLQFAIKNNKRINCFVMSCSVSHTQGDDIPQSNEISKLFIKGEPDLRRFNPGLYQLARGKKFISKLNILLDRYIGTIKQSFMHIVSNKRQYFNGYRSYVEDKKYDELFDIAENMIKYYSTHFYPFIQTFLNMHFFPDETFSFALLGEQHISNKLIERKTALHELSYRSYVMEIIKVKIFLMTEFMSICYTRLLMVVESVSIFVDCFNKLRRMYPPIPPPEMQQTCNLLDNASRYATALLDYFTRLLAISNYINDGMEESQPDSFSGYARYIDAVKQYNEGNARELYEEITEDLDYNRYGRNPHDNSLILLNPLPNGNTFRKTNKYLYKYKPIQNYDDAVLRRRSLKKKIYSKYRVGKLAQKANRPNEISV